ncbi:MAG: thiamine phosphate synthase, partial [Verrucomicrobiota bacterium]
MLKFIQSLFKSEPEAPAPDNLVLFTPTRSPWDAKTVVKLFDAGLGRLHVQSVRDWNVRQYEAFLQQVPEAFWNRIVLEEQPDLVLSRKLAGFQMIPGDRIPPRWPKTAALSLKCHSYDEMRSTPKGCHYLFLSPIFPSVSKRDYVPQRTHREFQVIVERWRAEGGCPVYGLGGITPQNAAHVRALGFDGMAFIGSVWESTQPVQAFLELERAWSGKDARKL